jgi:UDPglucose 6-dehydrogenase
MKIGIIGVGYVGLVSGTCFAEMGHEVYGVDYNEEKIEKLKNAECPIYEPGLEGLIKKNIESGRLRFSTDTNECIRASDIIFICVNTPPKENGEADLKYVEGAAREIATVMDKYKIIVDKSTVPVHTAKKVSETLKRYNSNGVEFDVVSNPEFLREGSAVHDSLNPDRVVIGAGSDRAAEMMQELYAPLKCPVIVTDINSAELIKHASNSFLALKISFANALSNICERAGANIEQVIHGMGLDSRIGPSFFRAGIGYGGSCFPKDVSAFIRISEALGYDFGILKAVEETNAKQKKLFVKKVEETLWVINGKTIGVLGLSFKPNTDDIRSAPAMEIIKDLVAEGAKIKAYDPEAMANTKQVLPDIEYCNGPYEVAEESEALLILTEWDEFKGLDLEKIKKLMAHPTVIDGRNIFEPAKMEKMGFTYKSIGR